VLFLQCLAAAIPARREIPADFSGRPMLGILVPAHNEAMVIAATLQSIQAQLVGGDRLLVVADNCSDDTADVARAHGAEVLSATMPSGAARVSPSRRVCSFSPTAPPQPLSSSTLIARSQRDVSTLLPKRCSALAGRCRDAI
jgi:cellulose synthase/poly-beta-1,6-N-acetylglucosamine synthase-like glycosyltransferase